MEITLHDNWFATGSSLDEFKDLIEKLNQMTKFVKVEANNLCFYYKLDSPTRGAYRVLLVMPDELYVYEQRLAEYKMSPEPEAQEPPIPLNGIISERKVNVELANETFASTGFIVGCNDSYSPFYMSKNSMVTLCARAGITIEQGRRSMYLTQALCEALGEKNAKMKMVIREVQGDGRIHQKAFAFLSDAYTPIPMDTLPKVLDRILEDKKMGETKVKEWYVDHTFTAIRIEFPDAGEEFSDISGIPDRVIPGLSIMTSDTGSSSFIVRGTYRVSGSGRHVTVDEYAHKHTGKVTPEAVLDACDKDIFQKFRNLPEALADKMGKIIGSDKKTIEKAYKKGMHELGLRKAMGVRRAKEMVEQLVAELDPSAVYSEYDIAMTFLGLADRIDGVSKTVLERIAKACGKAPFISYGAEKAAEEEEEIVLLPGV